MELLLYNVVTVLWVFTSQTEWSCSLHAVWYLFIDINIDVCDLPTVHLWWTTTVVGLKRGSLKNNLTEDGCGCELNKLQWINKFIQHWLLIITQSNFGKGHTLCGQQPYIHVLPAPSCQDKGEIVNPKSLYLIIGRIFYSTKWLTHLMLQRPHSSAPNLGLQQNNRCWMKNHWSKEGCQVKEIWICQMKEPPQI